MDRWHPRISRAIVHPVDCLMDEDPYVGGLIPWMKVRVQKDKSGGSISTETSLKFVDH